MKKLFSMSIMSVLCLNITAAEKSTGSTEIAKWQRNCSEQTELSPQLNSTSTG